MLEEMKKAFKKDKRYFSKRELKRQLDLLNWIVWLNYCLAVGVTSVLCVTLAMYHKLDDTIGMIVLVLWSLFVIVLGALCVDRTEQINKRLKNL